MEVFETSNNHSISLSCQVGSRPSPWSNVDNICIEWFFRGILVNSSCRDLDESQLDVVSEMTENNLILSVDDPWQLVGSIQCFVGISSPATDGHPCTVLSADVHIVAKGRLHSQLQYKKMMLFVYSNLLILVCGLYMCIRPSSKLCCM